MPEAPEGMTSIETTVPDSWKEKMDEDMEKKSVSSMRQYLRDIIYESFIKDQDQS
jgi:hypothetical protein